EAAADVGRDHAQLGLGDAEHEGAHEQADDVRVLAGGPQRGVVGGRVVFADGGARLHGVGHQAVVGEVELGHVRGAREGGVRRGGVADAPVVAGVVGDL